MTVLLWPLSTAMASSLLTWKMYTCNHNPHLWSSNKKSESSHLVVFGTRSNEGLVKTTKAAVDRVKALGDPHKLPDKGPKGVS